MKRKSLYLLSLLLLLLFAQQTFASHFAAADLQVTYIGKNPDGCGEPEYKYEVILTLYNACERTTTTWLGNTEFVFAYSPTVGGAPIQLQVDAMDPVTGIIYPKTPAYQGDTVHQLCPDFKDLNSCKILTNDTKYPAFIRWTYKGEITLPSAQTDWRFYWSGGARNSGIINLDQTNPPFKSNLYVEAGINNVAQYNVSTPRFTSDPLPYICVNNPTIYLNGPKDPQKKDTTIQLITYSQTPLNAFNDPYNYNAGYSPSNPIGSSTGFKIDKKSGTAEFMCTQTGPYVLGFRCDKIQHKGSPDETLLSYTMRDVQVSVLGCTNEPPQLASKHPINLTNATLKPVSDDDTAIYVCPGSELSFEVAANSKYPSHLLYYKTSDLTELPGAAFNYTGKGTDKIAGEFKWTPGKDDIGDHTVTIYAVDSTCDPSLPIVLRTPLIFKIRVLEGLNAGPDLKFCQFNTKTQQLYVDGTFGRLKVRWTDINGGAPIGMDNPESIAPKVTLQPGTASVGYKVYTTDLTASCKSSDDIYLNVDNDVSVSITPSDRTIVMCQPDYLQLEATMKGKPAIKNILCGIEKTRDLTIEESVTINGSPSLIKDKVYDTLGNVTPSFPNSVLTAKQQFFISKEDMASYGLYPGTIKSIILDAFEAKEPDYEYSNFTISMKCVPKMPKADGFVKDMIVVYAPKNPIKVPAGLNEFVLDNPYNWDSTQNLIIQICYSNNAGKTAIGGNPTLLCYPPVFKFVNTTYLSRIVYYPLDAAKNPDPTVKDVCGVNGNADQKVFYSRPSISFKFSPAPYDDVPFKWHGPFLSDSLIQQPLAYIPKTAQYIVEGKGINGCRIFDTLDVYLPVRDYKVTPSDSAICYGSDAILSINKGSFYKWYEYEDGQYKLPTSLNCNSCQVVNARPKKTTTYRIAVYDSVFCLDTIEAKVNVLPAPNVKVLTPDTVIKYGRSVQLMATGARQYNWSASGSLSTPNTSSPVATPIEPTSYVVTGIGANGCRSFDTVKVDIDYRDNIFVPTAFSPNGDGKNDVFRITNLTFQRLMEFRVFNRWGQEIFSTTDVKGGWDGTWKGEPQPVDNYRYIIRVGFPDGIVETYKGDVTLIR